MFHVLSLILLFVLTALGAEVNLPYPRSLVITDLIFHEETLERQAPGSDIWACTTDAGGILYTAWGDDGGFGGTDAQGHVSIGVGRITGVPPNWQGANL